MTTRERPRIIVAVTDSQSANLVGGQLADLRRRGAEAFFLSSPGAAATQLCLDEQVEGLAVPIARAPAPREDARALARLIAVMRRVRPHLVNAGTPKAALLVTAAAAAVRVPCRIHTLHGLRFTTLAGPKRQIVRLSQKAASVAAQLTICVSASLRHRALEHGLGRPERLVVLGAGSANGVDLARYTRSAETEASTRALCESLNIPATAQVVGFVGRVAADKGVAELAAAWQRLRVMPDRYLLVAGGEDPTDPVDPAVLASLRADERVRLIGARSDLPRVYGMMHVLILPTHREGFGNVLIEAAAMEVPVIATRVDGCVDAVADGVNGTLVPLGAVDALVDEAERYLRDPMLRRTQGLAGRARVERLFDQTIVLDSLADLYRSLLRSRRLPSLGWHERESITHRYIDDT